MSEPTAEARMTDKFTVLKFKLHFRSYTIFISKAYTHKMDTIQPLNYSHFVKLKCINNTLADYKSLLNTSTNLRV